MSASVHACVCMSAYVLCTVVHMPMNTWTATVISPYTVIETQLPENM